MKLKDRRQSENIRDDRKKPSILTTLESYSESAGNLLRDPGSGPIGAVTPKKVSDAMENAAKADRLTKSRRKLERTVKARPEESAEIGISEVYRPKQNNFRKEIGKYGFERATRKIQVTPGKWNIHEN